MWWVCPGYIELKPFAIGSANKQETHLFFLNRPFIQRITDRCKFSLNGIEVADLKRNMIDTAASRIDTVVIDRLPDEVQAYRRWRNSDYLSG